MTLLLVQCGKKWPLQKQQPLLDDSKKLWRGDREEIFFGFEPLMMIKRRVDKYTKYQKNISLDDDRGTSYYFLRGGPPENYTSSTDMLTQNRLLLYIYYLV